MAFLVWTAAVSGLFLVLDGAELLAKLAERWPS